MVYGMVSYGIVWHGNVYGLVWFMVSYGWIAYIYIKLYIKYTYHNIIYINSPLGFSHLIGRVHSNNYIIVISSRRSNF